MKREARAQPLQVDPVVAHFLRLAQIELADVAGHPAVGHVDQDERRAHAAGQGAHVGEDRLVGGATEEDHDESVDVIAVT